MKIIEAINRIDALKHNTYTQADKVRWLSTLDGMVKNHVIDTHEGAEEVSFTGYDGNTDLQTELLMPAPYDEAYLIWMESKIDYHNGEYGKYNNAVEMFNTAYDRYKAFYNRTHMPKTTKFKYFGGSATKQYQPTNPVVSVPTVRIAEVELLAEKWVGDASPYSQVVTIPGITNYSQVDLTPSVEQLAIFHNKDLAFVTENEDGVVAVYAIGQKPENDYTIQVSHLLGINWPLISEEYIYNFIKFLKDLEFFD